MSTKPLILKTADDMRAWSKTVLRAGRALGFVPTMGALHAGHKSLLERARRENDAVAASVYVNPTQFGPEEDFAKYPRTLDADAALCAQSGVDCIFAPDNLYGEESRTWVQVGGLDETLEGLSRPGHFRGVTTVVTKLFNIVRPDRAYFGRKDAQQFIIIQAMVRDLDLGVEIVPCETVREADGLALSSRNRFLSPRARQQAVALSRALEHAKKEIAAGERDAMELLGEMAEILEKEPDIEIDYVALVNAHTLADLKRLRGDVLAAIAVKLGATRLIDNAFFAQLD